MIAMDGNSKVISGINRLFNKMKSQNSMCGCVLCGSYAGRKLLSGCKK